MINLKIQGRLGNQMFQYAFAESLKEKYYNDEEIVVVYSKSKFSNACNFCEDNNPFKSKKLNSSNKLKVNFIQYFIFDGYLLMKYVFKLKNTDIKIQKFLNYFGIYFLQDDGYCEFGKSKFKNKIIYGYFGSEKFFENVKDKIKKLFDMEMNLSSSNKKMLNKIKENNSVCLSIRRGDYLDTNNKNYFYVCNEKYYKDSIQYIINKIKNPVFVVFSDDIEWVKNNMNLPENTVYENSDNTVYETLYLMKNCKNFIISNSTFHWWAQYLCNSNKNIVIAPSIWNTMDTGREIYMDNWTLIDIDKEKNIKNI